MVVTKVTKQDPVTKKSETAATKRPKRNEKGWQAEKSAMTRLAILEATIQCLARVGLRKHHHCINRKLCGPISWRNDASFSLAHVCDEGSG